MSDEWREQAACKGMPVRWWYPEVGGIADSRPRELCAGCPVRQECLEDAIRLGDAFGIRAGMSERQRRHYARRHGIPFGEARIVQYDVTERKVQQFECGTLAGYYAHRRRGEMTCDDCKAAKRTEFYNRKGGSAARIELRPCGTEAAYMRHMYHKQTPCEPCLEAHRVAVDERRQRQRQEVAS